jgi:small subunit ribosomal protein S25e
MGGIKKKTLSAMEKEALRKQQEEAAKDEKRRKEQKASQRVDAAGRVDEKAALSAMKELKAVTLYGLARALGVRASVANHLIRSFESRGLLQRVGGYQGHYVYTVADSGKAGR